MPLSTAYLGFVAVGLSNNVLGASWLVLRPAFGQSLGSVGVLIAALMLGGLASSLTSGWALARLRTSSYCAVGSVLALVGLLGYLGSSWTLLVVSTLVLGIGGGMLNAGLNTFVAAHYPASRMNWLHAFYGVGSSLGPFLFTLWALSLGLPWRWVYAGIAGVYLLLTLLMLRYRQAWPPLLFKSVAGTENPVKASLRVTLGLGVAWLGMALFFMHTGTSVSAGQLSSSLLNLGRGVPAEVAGNAAALYWACITLGRLLMGVVVDRVGSSRLLRFCTAGTVVGAVMLWFAPLPFISFLGVAVMGLTLAPVYPTSVSRTPALVGPTLSAHAIGVQVAAGSLGSAALPGILSGVADWGGASLIAPGLVVFALLQFIAHEALVRYGPRRTVSMPANV